MPKKVNDISELAEGLGLDTAGISKVRQRVASRSVSNMLSALRVRCGLTQKELASRMGKTQSAVSKLETASDDDFRLGDIRAYAAAIGFGISIDFTEPMTLAREIRQQLDHFVRLIDRLKEFDSGDAAVSEALDKFKNDMSGKLLDLFLVLTPAARNSATEQNSELSVGFLPESSEFPAESCSAR